MPAKAMNKANSFTYWLFGIKEEKDKNLLKEIFSDTNTQFSKWAVGQILNWKRRVIPANIIRIHGSKDHVLPLHLKVDHLVKGGGHFMIVNKAAQISQILSHEIASLNK